MLVRHFVRGSSLLRRLAQDVRKTTLKGCHTWSEAASVLEIMSGPTNSGKTHNAIEALKRSEVGVYCSPLRLLALEQYDRLNQVVWIESHPPPRVGGVHHIGPSQNTVDGL